MKPITTLAVISIFTFTSFAHAQMEHASDKVVQAENQKMDAREQCRRFTEEFRQLIRMQTAQDVRQRLFFRVEQEYSLLPALIVTDPKICMSKGKDRLILTDAIVRVAHEIQTLKARTTSQVELWHEPKLDSIQATSGDVQREEQISYEITQTLNSTAVDVLRFSTCHEAQKSASISLPQSGIGSLDICVAIFDEEGHLHPKDPHKVLLEVLRVLREDPDLIQRSSLLKRWFGSFRMDYPFPTD